MFKKEYIFLGHLTFIPSIQEDKLSSVIERVAHDRTNYTVVSIRYITKVSPLQILYYSRHR